MFADVAGRTTEVIDANAREIIPAQIFVAVRGASYLGRRDLNHSACPIGSEGSPLRRGAGAARFIRFSTGTETSRRVF